MNANDTIGDYGLMIRQWQHDLRSPLSALEVITARLKKQGASEAAVLAATLQRLRSLSDEIPSTNKTFESPVPFITDEEPEVTLPLALQNLFLEKRTEYLSRKDVEFIFKNLLEASVRVALTPSDFQRMISNLINNSFEAIDGSGWVRVNLWQENDWVVIQVSDSGVGIPQDMREKVVECGFSYGKDTGSGLGLYHAQTVVGQAGGDLRIESQKLGGTTVQVRLPVV